MHGRRPPNADNGMHASLLHGPHSKSRCSEEAYLRSGRPIGTYSRATSYPRTFGIMKLRCRRSRIRRPLAIPAWSPSRTSRPMRNRSRIPNRNRNRSPALSPYPTRTSPHSAVRSSPSRIRRLGILRQLRSIPGLGNRSNFANRPTCPTRSRPIRHRPKSSRPAWSCRRNPARRPNRPEKPRALTTPDRPTARQRAALALRRRLGPSWRSPR